MSQAALASKTPNVMRIADMTKQTREVFQAILADKLKYWTENKYIRIESDDSGIRVSQDKTMDSGVLKDIAEVANTFEVSFFVTCEMMSIVANIY